MIITKVRLHTFAGLTDVELEFAPGLNTIVGENEAGKSTVFRALEKGLLERSDLTPARMKKFVAPYVPVGGGNTIAVELHFIHEDGQYSLRRQWGADSAARLTLPGGGLITGEEEIAARVIELLGMPVGTCRSILFTRQTLLSETLETLKDEDRETVRDLSDLLSAAMQETDGVSVDALEERLEEEAGRFYSRWDKERGRPEGNRGVNKPWKKGVGLILAAYYAKEEISEALDEARATEYEVDRLNAGLRDLAEKKERLSQYVEKNRRVVEDARRRQVVEAREQSLEEQLKRLRKDNEDWPLAKKAIADAETASALLASRIAALEKEQTDVKRHEEGRALRELAERVKARQRELEESRAELANVPHVTRDHIEKIDRAAATLRELEVRLEAAKLRVSLSAKKGLSVRTTSGLDDPVDLNLDSGASHTLEGDGRLTIEHDDWKIEVESGELDVATITGEAERANSEFDMALEECGATSREEAVSLNEAFEQAKAGLEHAESNVASELEDNTLGELEAQLAEVGDSTEVRPLEEVVRELADAEYKKTDLEEVLAESRERITALEEAYGDADGLLDTTAKAHFEKKEIVREKEGLAPLPDGVDDAGAFLEEFEERQEELRACEVDINQKRIELAEVRLPDESTEELEARLELAEEEFERALRQGRVIDRIIEAMEEVEAESAQGDPYAGFRSEVEGYVSRLTSERYQSIQIDDGLPSGFVRGDGAVLGTHLLSTGTQDVLGLSIRLAMAGFFLNGRQGFLVMDDPLVDMDPVRQESAASLLREYAEDNDRQVIVFTCFPGHAEMLGGRKVELG